ncbi:DUF6596 domain-containing protein [Streptomyces omiyaensis]|uniref:DUF6596 domain-containing protein n=1 Tax=Streptomyces omiyaensis TaxID=68247 RepID=UPI0036FB5D06
MRHVLYLVFDEGYTASGGEEPTAPVLSVEAIRPARLPHRLVPEDTETAGLLALVPLTAAPRPARTGPGASRCRRPSRSGAAGARPLVAGGVELISGALPRGRVGPYRIQAAIAAVHDGAETAEATDRPQILLLDELPERTGPNPTVTLNRAVAVAVVEGPRAGPEPPDTPASDGRLVRHHRLLATRAHLLEPSGDPAAAGSRPAGRPPGAPPAPRSGGHLTERARPAGVGGGGASGAPRSRCVYPYVTWGTVFDPDWRGAGAMWQTSGVARLSADAARLPPGGPEASPTVLVAPSQERTYGNLPGSVSGVPARRPVGVHPRPRSSARTPLVGKSFGSSS